MASGTLTFDKASGMAQGVYSDFVHNKLKISFEPCPRAPRALDSDENEPPSHNVYAQPQGGNMSLCGGAWEHTVKDGPNKGQKFYTFTLDDPNWNKPLRLAAFPVRGSDGKQVPGEYEIVFRRPKQAQAA